jgi:hypothetical protein
MGRVRNWASLVALIALITTVAVWAASGSSAAGRHPTEVGNREIARQDARTHVDSVALPPGARRSPAEPAGDHGYLKPARTLMAATKRADAHAWWRVPGDPGAVLAYVKAHPPQGATVFSTGRGGDSRTGTFVLSVSFAWPPVAGVLRMRLLNVSVTSVSGGGSGILGQAESIWFVPRPRRDEVPASVREIDLVRSAGRAGSPPVATVHVTGPAKVRRLLHFVNRLPTVQPGATACPNERPPAVRLALLFRRRPGGVILARADYAGDPSLAGASTACRPVALSLRGGRSTLLIGGDFVAHLRRILGPLRVLRP